MTDKTQSSCHLVGPQVSLPRCNWRARSLIVMLVATQTGIALPEMLTPGNP